MKEGRCGNLMYFRKFPWTFDPSEEKIQAPQKKKRHHDCSTSSPSVPLLPQVDDEISFFTLGILSNEVLDRYTTSLGRGDAAGGRGGESDGGDEGAERR